MNLTGVQMPSALTDLGLGSNPGAQMSPEEMRLRKKKIMAAGTPNMGDPMSRYGSASMALLGSPARM
jgi:hypothetical protein